MLEYTIFLDSRAIYVLQWIMRFKMGHPLLPLLCAAGAVLNIVIPTILQQRFGIPLYMDTVFTMALTFYGGLAWGLATGALTNIISSTVIFTGWADYLFALCNMAAALVTCMFIRCFPRELGLRSRAAGAPPALPAPNSRRLKNIMDRVWVLILLSFALCVVISILGGLIAAGIKTFSPSLGGRGPELIFNTAFFRQNLSSLPPALWAEILSRIPVNIIDRLVSSFAAYGIAALMARAHTRAGFGMD